MMRLKKSISMLYQQKSRNLDRSGKVDSQQVAASRFPKSGFDLTYRSYNDFQLGRLHVSGYHHTMPGDKFNGLNRGQFQFNRLVVPTISPIEVSQHNFYMPYRSLDVTFEEAFAPGKLNAMSENWRAPSFTLDEIRPLLFDWQTVSEEKPLEYLGYYRELSGFLHLIAMHLEDGLPVPTTSLSGTYADLGTMLFSNMLGADWNSMYLADMLAEIKANIARGSVYTFPSDSNGVILDGFIQWYYDAVVRYFIGEGSLLDQLGYNIVRRVDFMIDGQGYDFLKHFFGAVSATTPVSLADMAFSVIPMNEYPIRAYYAIWYEYYRDANLEPVSPNLPKYRQFGSASVVTQYPLMLLMRPRCWQHDLHVSSMPDDPFRHVFAPVLNPAISSAQALANQVNSLDAEALQQLTNSSPSFANGNLIRSETISWLDPVDGTNKKLVLPIPALVSDAISALDSGSNLAVTRLDLQTLRRAQALERVLKRNFYFGDEYKDRMLAHYGSVVSDDRVNRPAVLSSSITTINTTEQVANVGTEDTPQGTRNVVASAGTSDDGYTFFAEEFGVVMNFISFMPIAQYNGICPQLLQSRVVDFPLPEYATQFSEASRILEVSLAPFVQPTSEQARLFGHQPYAHAYRARVDEIHGSYLSTKANQTFRRFFGMDKEAFTVPKLNYLFVHCNPPLDMFANQVRFDGQLYGYVDHMFTVERCLPTPAEEI